VDVIVTGLLLALVAGLSTVAGGAVIFFIKELKKSYLAFSLAFSAGVMITVSFVELLPEGIKVLGYGNALVAFFAGSAVVLLIDYFVPHEYITEKVLKTGRANSRILKTGLFVALGLAIHNFPEGFAVLAGNLQSPELGIIIAMAIAIHNIPEGIAISIPIYYATKRKRKALFITFLAGIAEPIGALIGALILQLLPTAVNYAEKNSHLMTGGFFFGSIVIGAVLMLLA
jgi:ZIP family zinc transporter